MAEGDTRYVRQFLPAPNIPALPRHVCGVQGREVAQSCIMLLQSEAESHGD